MRPGICKPNLPDERSTARGSTVRRRFSQIRQLRSSIAISFAETREIEICWKLQRLVASKPLITWRGDLHRDCRRILRIVGIYGTNIPLTSRSWVSADDCDMKIIICTPPPWVVARPDRERRWNSRRRFRACCPSRIIELIIPCHLQVSKFCPINTVSGTVCFQVHRSPSSEINGGRYRTGIRTRPRSPLDVHFPYVAFAFPHSICIHGDSFRMHRTGA